MLEHCNDDDDDRPFAFDIDPNESGKNTFIQLFIAFIFVRLFFSLPWNYAIVPFIWTMPHSICDRRIDDERLRRKKKNRSNLFLISKMVNKSKNRFNFFFIILRLFCDAFWIRWFSFLSFCLFLLFCDSMIFFSNVPIEIVFERAFALQKVHRIINEKRELAHRHTHTYQTKRQKSIKCVLSRTNSMKTEIATMKIKWRLFCDVCLFFSSYSNFADAVSPIFCRLASTIEKSAQIKCVFFPSRVRQWRQKEERIETTEKYKRKQKNG